MPEGKNEDKNENENKKHYILFVDDDPNILRLIGGALSNAGFDLWYAHDGNEGREMARRLKPDLILMDLRMPVMDGLETAYQLKKEDITKNIPIILLTSGDISLYSSRNLDELGIDEYVHKGAPFKELLAAALRVLKARGHDVSEIKTEQ